MKRSLYLFLFFPIMIWSQSNFEKAEILFKEGNYSQAQSIFETLLKTNENNISVIEYLGDIAGFNKKWDAALYYYGKLKVLKPKEANSYFKYGGVLGMKARTVNKFRALGLIDEIKESFEKAIVLNPKHIEARWALIELYIQLPSIVGGSEFKAIKYSDELLRFSPVDGYLSRGHIEEYFKRYLNAEKYYLKANEIGKSKITYQNLYNLYKNKLNQKNKAEALTKN